MHASFRSLIFSIFILIVFNGKIFSQSDSLAHAPVSALENGTEEIFWDGSIYFSGGYSSIQGFRFELGYNWNVISIGLNVSVEDEWTKHSSDPQFGLIAKINFYNSQNISPYILAGRGGSVAILGSSDTYTLINLGMRIKMIKWLHICPEIGVMFTSEFVSGGWSLFGGSSPKVYSHNTSSSANILFEIDFAEIF